MHSRIRRANQDSSETGGRALWVILGVLTVALAAALVDVAAHGLSTTTRFFVVLGGGLSGPVAAWVILFLYRLVRPIPRWQSGMAAMDGTDRFTVETLNDSAPSVGPIEVWSRTPSGQKKLWVTAERLTFDGGSGLRAYILEYPEDAWGPPEVGEHQFKFRGNVWGDPASLLAIGRYEFTANEEWFGLRDAD